MSQIYVSCQYQVTRSTHSYTALIMVIFVFARSTFKSGSKEAYTVTKIMRLVPDKEIIRKCCAERTLLSCQARSIFLPAI
jgi:hypothetical protein